MGPESTTTTTQFNPNPSRAGYRRRFSTPHSKRTVPLLSCNPLALPDSLSALDLSSASPTPLLASLRVLVLYHLAELELSLSNFDLPLSETLRCKREDTVEEARMWAREGLDMLRRIRHDVSSHLPDLYFDASSVEDLVRSHMHDLPGLDDVRLHFPDIPNVRSHLPEFDLTDMRSRLSDVRAHLPGMPIDLNQPLKYLPTLSSHLQSLHAHLSPGQMYSDCQLLSLPSTGTIVNLLDQLLTSYLLPDALCSSVDGHEGTIEKATREITNAVKRSLNGSRLVTYFDLPQEWQNNPFVKRGYRFIPLKRWPLILLSLFALHNETLNIHTHMIPLLHSSLHLLPFLNYPSDAADLPEKCFTAFSQACLFSSVLWHTMSGCAHRQGMEFCARVDYVGIGWLISASIGSVVYYGFSCHSQAIKTYLTVCLLTGLVGSVLPFMKWFNDARHRKWRVTFFLTLCFTALAPLAHLSYLYGFSEMLSFISPVFPSLLSYFIGLLFYVSHVPERFLSGKESLSRWTDLLGGGSHAIWHAFIVVAIYQHKWAMRELKHGFSGDNCVP